MEPLDSQLIDAYREHTRGGPARSCADRVMAEIEVSTDMPLSITKGLMVVALVTVGLSFMVVSRYAEKSPGGQMPSYQAGGEPMIFSQPAE
ncbi:hypothetical protein Rhal01_02788 [Rubritalea halochordaticola]|uniref:Uncharacterized protein n=1 Tax=Rubritalea halochordaticola TaxID=714537 RepID=A0ABP9V260_9BACT